MPGHLDRAWAPVYGKAASADPDAVAYDAVGIVSGTPGAVLVGGGLPGAGAAISKINTNGVVSTPAIGFTLQSTDSLAPTNWVNAPNGTNNPATVPATLPGRFYRLFKP